MKTSAALLFVVVAVVALGLGVESNCGCLKCSKHLQVVSPPHHPIKLIYRGQACNCAKSIPYTIEKPIVPKECNKPKHYTYQCHAVKLTKPVYETPAYYHGYSIEVPKVEPSQKTTCYVGLYAAPDRIVIPAEGCHEDHKPETCAHGPIFDSLKNVEEEECNCPYTAFRTLRYKRELNGEFTASQEENIERNIREIFFNETVDKGAGKGRTRKFNLGEFRRRLFRGTPFRLPLYGRRLRREAPGELYRVAELADNDILGDCFDWDRLLPQIPLFYFVNAPVKMLKHFHNLKKHLEPVVGCVPAVLDTSRKYLVDFGSKLHGTALSFAEQFMDGFKRSKRSLISNSSGPNSADSKFVEHGLKQSKRNHGGASFGPIHGVGRFVERPMHEYKHPKRGRASNRSVLGDRLGRKFSEQRLNGFKRNLEPNYRGASCGSDLEQGLHGPKRHKQNQGEASPTGHPGVKAIVSFSKQELHEDQPPKLGGTSSGSDLGKRPGGKFSKRKSEGASSGLDKTGVSFTEQVFKRLKRSLEPNHKDTGFVSDPESKSGPTPDVHHANQLIDEFKRSMEPKFKGVNFGRDLAFVNINPSNFTYALVYENFNTSSAKVYLVEIPKAHRSKRALLQVVDDLDHKSSSDEIFENHYNSIPKLRQPLNPNKLKVVLEKFTPPKSDLSELVAAKQLNVDHHDHHDFDPEKNEEVIRAEITAILDRVQALIHVDFTQDAKLSADLLKLQFLKDTLVTDWRDLSAEDVKSKQHILNYIGELTRFKRSLVKRIAQFLVKGTFNRSNLIKSLVQLYKLNGIFTRIAEDFGEKLRTGARFHAHNEKSYMARLGRLRFLETKHKQDILVDLKKVRDAELQKELVLLERLRKLLDHHDITDEIREEIKSAARLVRETMRMRKVQQRTVRELNTKVRMGQNYRRELKALYDLERHLADSYEQLAQVEEKAASEEVVQAKAEKAKVNLKEKIADLVKTFEAKRSAWLGKLKLETR